MQESGVSHSIGCLTSIEIGGRLWPLRLRLRVRLWSRRGFYNQPTPHRAKRESNIEQKSKCPPIHPVFRSPSVVLPVLQRGHPSNHRSSVHIPYPNLPRTSQPRDIPMVLSEEMAKLCRDIYKRGVSTADMAMMFGVHRTSIQRCVSNTTWKFL